MSVTLQNPSWLKLKYKPQKATAYAPDPATVKNLRSKITQKSCKLAVPGVLATAAYFLADMMKPSNDSSPVFLLWFGIGLIAIAIIHGIASSQNISRSIGPNGITISNEPDGVRVSETTFLPWEQISGVFASYRAEKRIQNGIEHHLFYPIAIDIGIIDTAKINDPKKRAVSPKPLPNGTKPGKISIECRFFDAETQYRIIHEMRLALENHVPVRYTSDIHRNQTVIMLMHKPATEIWATEEKTRNTDRQLWLADFFKDPPKREEW
ncbi:MAG: hypothetical protein Q4C71_02375 [Microbacteriaceae bacterium]|nr:hypothetical protein [Microbacteriaceae bacterium]